MSVPSFRNPADLDDFMERTCPSPPHFFLISNARYLAPGTGGNSVFLLGFVGLELARERWWWSIMAASCAAYRAPATGGRWVPSAILRAAEADICWTGDGC